MKKITSLLTFILFLFLSGFSQKIGETKFIEKVEAIPGQPIITYSKYELANGLTLLVHENPSAPIVHVEVTYKVGSSRELPGRSGFAHFFEHMMFQGSEHVADEEHFKIVQSAGGQMNGTTNRDRTNYFQTVPSNMLETMLWLEADRMGFLPNAFTDEKFEVQRNTVKNEKDQNYGVPYGFVSEVKDQLLYPKGHPYSWPIIGFTDDLDNATRDDLNSFFLRYYGPNNAILVVTGDVNTAEVVSLTEKYFGSIPRGPEVRKMSAPSFRLPESEYKTYYDNIYAPLTYMVFPTVPSFHRDEAALDLLADLLAGGKNSVFYKKFIKDEKALDISVSHPTFELTGEFSITAVSYPYTETIDIKNLILQAIEEFEKTGFSDDDLLRVKEGRIAELYSSFESNAAKASILTQFEMMLPGRKYNIMDEIDRYRNVNKTDIMRVLKQYVKGKNFACIFVEPDPNIQLGKKPKPFVSFNPFAGIKPDYSEFKGLTYNRPVDDFDRSIKPVPPAAKPVVVPDFYRFSLKNGVSVAGNQNDESNRVVFYIEIEGGNLFEDGKKVPFGTAYITAAMLNESTIKLPSAELEEAIAKLGSSINFSSSGSSITAFVSCYKEKIPETLELFEQMLTSPNFETNDFNLLKKRLLEGIANQRFSSGIIANKAFSKLLYGDNIPLGKYYTGNYNDFKKINIQHVVAYHQNFISPKNMKIITVGNLTQEEVRNHLSFTEKLEAKNVSIPSFTNFPNYNTTQVFMINQNNAPLSQIIIGNRSLPFDAYGDFFMSNVMNFALGGNFNSRLNLSIREDKGWTYGIGSSFSSSSGNHPGSFSIRASIKGPATDSAITEIFSIINKYRTEGITDEELSYTKSALVSSDALRYETSIRKAVFLMGIINRNLDSDYRAKQAELINKISKEDINKYAQQYLNPSNMLVVVVGNQTTLKPKLDALGFGKVQILDANGSGKVKIYKK